VCACVCHTGVAAMHDLDMNVVITIVCLYVYVYVCVRVCVRVCVPHGSCCHA